MAGPVKKREVQQEYEKNSDDESDNSSLGREDNENKVENEQVIKNKYFTYETCNVIHYQIPNLNLNLG